MTTPGICPPCWKKLDFITAPVCHQCGEPSLIPLRGQVICSGCQRGAAMFDQHRSLFRYGTDVKKMIFALKHGRDRTLVPFFTTVLTPLALQMAERVDLVMPVPLHWMRLSYRCFNQSAILAKGIAGALNLPLDVWTLRRVQRTRTQGGLNRAQRRANVHAVFAVRKPERIQGATILLIDDVYTTGATLNACATALKEAGALEVKALTLTKVTGYR